MTDVQVWTLALLALAGIGAVLSLFDVQDTLKDRRDLRDSHRQSSLLWVGAHGNVRTAFQTFGMFTCIVVAMAVALVVEASTVRQIVVRAGVMGAMCLLTSKRIFDRMDRRRIKRLQRAALIEVVPGSSLDRAGGQTGLDQLVAGIYARVLLDEALKRHFVGISVSRLIYTQAEWLTRKLAHLPTSVDLMKAHAHLQISRAEFERFMTISAETMRDFRVPVDVSEEIASIMSGGLDQIVTRTQP